MYGAVVAPQPQNVVRPRPGLLPTTASWDSQPLLSWRGKAIYVTIPPLPRSSPYALCPVLYAVITRHGTCLWLK